MRPENAPDGRDEMELESKKLYAYTDAGPYSAEFQRCQLFEASECAGLDVFNRVVREDADWGTNTKL